jgi:regulator of sigma D
VHCEIDNTLWAELSRLGEELATRVELEDRLITAIRAPATV